MIKVNQFAFAGAAATGAAVVGGTGLAVLAPHLETPEQRTWTAGTHAKVAAGELVAGFIGAAIAIKVHQRLDASTVTHTSAALATAALGGASIGAISLGMTGGLVAGGMVIAPYPNRPT